MPEQLGIRDDESVAVFLGKGMTPTAPFSTHPQVQWLDAHRMSFNELQPLLPSKPKAFILTNGIEQSTYSKLAEHARNKNVFYLHRRSPDAVRYELYALLPKVEQARRTHVLPLGVDAPILPTTDTIKAPAQMPTPAPPQKGHLQRFLDTQTIDFVLPRIQEATRLFAVAQQAGVQTTIGSIANAIAGRAKAVGQGRPRIGWKKTKAKKAPAPVLPPIAPLRRTYDDPGRKIKARSKPSVNGNWGHEGIAVLDQAIAGLERMRDWATRTSQQNSELREKLDSIQQALAKLGM
jgi:hypothetical protein